MKRPGTDPTYCCDVLFFPRTGLDGIGVVPCPYALISDDPPVSCPDPGVEDYGDGEYTQPDTGE